MHAATDERFFVTTIESAFITRRLNPGETAVSGKAVRRIALGPPWEGQSAWAKLLRRSSRLAPRLEVPSN